MKQKIQIWRIFLRYISWVIGLFGLGLSGYYFLCYTFGDLQNLWLAGYSLVFVVIFYELLRRLVHLHNSDEKKRKKF